MNKDKLIEILDSIKKEYKEESFNKFCYVDLEEGISYPINISENVNTTNAYLHFLNMQQKIIELQQNNDCKQIEMDMLVYPLYPQRYINEIIKYILSVSKNRGIRDFSRQVKQKLVLDFASKDVMAIQFIIKAVNTSDLKNIIKSNRRYIVNIEELKQLLSSDGYDTSFTLSDEKVELLKYHSKTYTKKKN